MLTMMSRAGGFSEDDQLLQLYDNMHPNYKIYENRHQQSPRPPTTGLIAAGAVNSVGKPELIANGKRRNSARNEDVMAF